MALNVTIPPGAVLTTANEQELLFTATAGETYVQVRLLDASTLNEVAELKPVPIFANVARVDLSPYVSAVLVPADNTDNARMQSISTQVGLADQFVLQYRSDVGTAYTSYPDNITFSVGVRQIGNAPNFDSFDVEIATGGAVTKQLQFLTIRERPKLRYYASGIISSKADVSAWQQQIGYALTPQGATIEFKFEYFANGTIQKTLQSGVSGVDGVNIIDIPELETIYQYQQVQCTLLIDSAIAGTITFDVEQACINPYAVKFLNEFGVFETFVFTGDNTTTAEAETLDAFERYPDNLQTATGFGQSLSKRRQDIIELQTDNLNTSEAEALAGIIDSPLVLLFVGELEAGTAFDDWQIVQVTSTSIERPNTRQTKHRASIELALPRRLSINN